MLNRLYRAIPFLPLVLLVLLHVLHVGITFIFLSMVTSITVTPTNVLYSLYTHTHAHTRVCSLFPHLYIIPV